MYTIYANQTIIYHPNVEELLIVKGSVSREVNKSSSFTFTITQNHPYYDKLKKYKTIITVYKDREIIFRGRIINDSSNYRNTKTLVCEGELSFLLDSIQRPYEFTGTPAELFAKFIAEHNRQVDDEKQFEIGEITVTDPNDYINRSYTEYKDTLTNVNEKLVNSLGGYLHITRNEQGKAVLNYFDDFKYRSNQKIEFGENLIDFTRTNNAEDVVTAIIPLGAKPEGSEERITIADVNGGIDYVYDEEAVANYGWIFETVTWDDVTVPQNLLTKAKTELAERIKQSVTIELTAVDLSLMDKDIDSFCIGDYIDIVSKPHGVDASYLLTKQSVDLLRPDNDRIILGYTYSSFTDDSLQNNNQNGNIIDRVETIIGDYELNKPIIDEITNRLILEIERNHPLTQNYNPDTGIYTPDYTQQPLVMAPVAKYRNKPVTCTYIWKRIVDGEEFDLEGWETVDGSGVLTISKNFGTAYRVYKCYATYQNAGISAVDNARVEFNKISDGKAGEGLPGKPGADGKSSYTHLAYANSADGQTDFSVSDSNRSYVGMYVDDQIADSTNPADYAWSRIRGRDGENGLPGKPGQDGRTPYFHTAYANSPDGTEGFSTTDPVGKSYIGQYTDYTEADSTNPQDYLWAKFKGNDGTDGKDAAIQSPTEPEDKDQLWLDTSLVPPVLKQWNGEEWIIVNDNSGAIEDLRQELTSVIEQTSQGIRMEVAENYYSQSDAEELKASISTEFEQTNKQFEFKFEEFNTALGDLSDSTNSEFQRILKYIRFVDGNIILGEEGNELTLKIQNNRISFLQSDAEVAYLSNRKLYVTDGEFLNSLQIGNFGFMPRNNGHLSFVKVR